MNHPFHLASPTLELDDAAANVIEAARRAATSYHGRSVHTPEVLEGCIFQSFAPLVARLEAERDAALAEVKRLAGDRIEITDSARAGT